MSASGDSASTIAKSASDLIDREGGLAAFFQNVGVGGIGYAIILEVIAGVSAVGLLLTGPIRALGRMTIRFIEATFLGLISVFGAGTQTTVTSYTSGFTAWLGPLAQPASVGTIMLSLVVFFYGVNYVSWSPWAFITSIRE